MRGWLLNASRFCVSPTANFSDNNASCYWGLPSISADDVAFPKLGYWRGYVWGPMSLLTYWGLSHPAYAHLPGMTISPSPGPNPSPLPSPIDYSLGPLTPGLCAPARYDH